MENDIFILNVCGGQWEDAYTIPMFYVASQEEGEALAKLAKEEWLAAMEKYPPLPDNDYENDATQPNWTEAQWDAYHEAREAKFMEVLVNRQACLTVDLSAPLDDHDDAPFYTVKKLSSRAEYIASGGRVDHTQYHDEEEETLNPESFV